MAYKTLINGSVDNTSDEIVKSLQLLASTAGVFDKASNEAKVTQRAAGANLSVDVTCGSVLVANASYTANVGDGVNKYYVAQWDAVVNTAVPTADLSNPRIDLVTVKVDSAALATNPTRGASAAAITIVTGAASATPSRPALPSNSLELAYYTLGAAGTSITNAMIIDSRQQVQLRNDIFDEPVLENANYLEGKSTGGVDMPMIGMSATNVLTIGTASNSGALIVSGGDILMANNIAARVYANTNQSIPTNSNTKIMFDTETYDVGSDFATGTYRFTAPVTGYYKCSATVRVNDLGDGIRGLLLLFVDNSEYSRVEVDQPGAATDMSATHWDRPYVTAGSYFEYYYNHNGAAAKNIQSGSNITYAAFIYDSI